jgi:hypothetical protein
MKRLASLFPIALTISLLLELSNSQVTDVSSLTTPNEKKLLSRDGQQLFQAICDADTHCSEYFVVGNEVIFGSFSASTVTEAVVFGIICDNFCGVATKLFQFRDGNWKVLYGHLSGDACASFRQDNQTDILVCQNESIWDFNLESEEPVDPRIYFYSLTAFEAGNQDWQKTTFVNLEIPMQPKCQSEDNAYTMNEWVYGFQFRKADVNDDGYRDVTLNVELLKDFCFFESSTEPIYKQQEKHQLVWLFDGDTFTPVETTREFLIRYKLEGK